MAVIFRAPLITAIARRSTAVANAAESRPNNRLLLLKDQRLPGGFEDWALAPHLPALMSVHARPGTPIIGEPYKQRWWPNPAPPLLQVLVEPVRNMILFPPPPIGEPFKNRDFPSPHAPILKPETHLFYYMQDQTAPSFIQYDWPTAPRLPTIETAPIRNEIIFPVPGVVQDPIKQRDWPTAAILRPPTVSDPYNFNVFLPEPQGQARHFHDWPRPHGARSLLDTHSVNTLGLLSLPIFKPVKPIDWPNPRPVPQSAAARAVRADGVSILLVPRFKPEWAADSNQLIGPTEPQPETH
jgi:hypothetical protein